MGRILNDLKKLSETRNIKEVPPQPVIFVVAKCSLKQAEKAEWTCDIFVAGKSDNLIESIKKLKLPFDDYFYWFSTELPQDTQKELVRHIQGHISAAHSPGK